MNFNERSECNGYVTLKASSHHKSFDREGNGQKSYVYEHHVVAEEMLGRSLKDFEVVHHLDGNKKNNSPDNLLVLERDQHTKLHAWIKNNVIVPKPAYAVRKIKGCIRCLECGKPIPPSNEKFCSQECFSSYRRKELIEQTSPEYLKELISKHSMVAAAKIVGLSDRGLAKCCKALGVL